MNRLMVACCVVVIAMLRPVYAGPAPAPGCCACFITDHDQAVPAFFCTSPSSESERMVAQNSCDAIPNASLLCAAPDVIGPATDDCIDLLRGLGIICPSTRAPALGRTGLAGVAALLTILGAAVLRRRAAQRR